MNFHTMNIDDVSWKILQALQENARISFSELGRQVGLTPPAVAERVRRLEDVGIIEGYRAVVNVQKLGLPLNAIIRFAARGRGSAETKRRLAGIPEIIECFHVTGEDCYVLRIAVPSTAHLEGLLERLTDFGDTTTSIVLSTPFASRVIDHEMVAAPRGLGD
ncbi:MAG TPA: Lrp/AsnC family transcriptional regulator [Chloroflexota bacterium]|jgi:Lrp/AsnC family leucine-responsive transcriptional regulator|nr:Lrp/AsnC family transcriptional regulator [Chloroflexota bacterium]